MDYSKDIKKLTEELIKKIGFKTKITVAREGENYDIHIETEDEPSLLIGKHARMLASIQRILSTMLYKKYGEKISVLVDINDYRDVQKERLTGISDNVAQRVIDEKRSARLSSFSPFERKIIHEHISTHYLSLTSYSQGDGRDRVLIIDFKKEEPSEESPEIEI